LYKFDVYYYSLDANWALFALSLWVVSILEDRELRAHFGAEYEAYARRVPRLFPN
jgi:protein-S-isoprenylcysteine O-methyltransferase Ste14